MDDERTLLLGGYGAAGRDIARVLLRENETRPLCIAGRRRAPAEEMKQRLHEEFPRSDVSAGRVDATQAPELQQACAACTRLVVCIPFSVTGSLVFRVAAEAGVDLIDLTPDENKYAVLDELNPALIQSGTSFLVDGGINPGCPSMIVRALAERSDRLEQVEISSLFQTAELPEGGARDMILQSDNAFRAFRRRRWRRMPLTATERIDFGHPYGLHTTAPVYAPELEELPSQLNLEELTMRQTGFNSFADATLLAAGKLGVHRSSKATELATRLLRWSVRRSSPPFGVVLQAQGVGQNNAHRGVSSLRLQHDDLYEATAIPVAAAIDQMEHGLISAGWNFMGHGVKLPNFLVKLEQLGIVATMEHQKAM